MNAIALRPHVRAAAVADDLVLLDIAADAYLCLPGAGPAWTAWRRDGQPIAAADALGRALVEAGLAEPGAPPTPRRPLGLPRRRIPELDADVTAADGARLLLAYVDLLRGYRGRSFARILEFVRRPPSRPAAPRDPNELARLCAVFHRLAVWLPLSDKCLERSFVLLRFLQRSGHEACWRFGVRLRPFGAHCWLQWEDLVLDDWPERLAAYAPIHDA